jgi:5'-methylthioadenosine phosphorylase
MKNRSVVHIDVSDPFCPVIRKLVEDSLKSLNFRYHKNATYAATEGPRLETSAEIKALSVLGADIVGMTLVPEVVLAKELTMHFASLSVVTNLAAGIKGEKLTSEEVIEMMEKKNEDIKKVILYVVENLPEYFQCECPLSLEGAAI